MRDYTIDCKNFGFTKETEVSYKNRRLVTQGLDIAKLCHLWRWYYYIPPFEKIFLVVSKRLYEALRQRPLASSKSVKEHFEEHGVELVCKEAEE